jgi:hypothetical protein
MTGDRLVVAAVAGGGCTGSESGVGVGSTISAGAVIMAVWGNSIEFNETNMKAKPKPTAIR